MHDYQGWLKAQVGKVILDLKSERSQKYLILIYYYKIKKYLI